MGNHEAWEQRIETNGQLGRRFFQELDRLRGGPLPELCAPGYTARLGSNPAMDFASYQAFSSGFYAGFPDAEHDIEDVLATPDAAVLRFVLRGTHRGNFFGIPASGRSVQIVGHIILRIREGKVLELLGVFDEAGLLRQIGVLPGG